MPMVYRHGNQVRTENQKNTSYQENMFISSLLPFSPAFRHILHETTEYFTLNANIRTHFMI